MPLRMPFTSIALMKKNILLTLIVFVTVALLYMLVHYMGMLGGTFALSLNFMLMACVLLFTETMKSAFTSPYFQPKSWERKGRVYELLGINLYRKFLVITGWEKLHKKTKPVAKSDDALANLHYRTKQDELGHLIIAVIVSGFTVFVAYRHGIANALWLLGFNMLLNVYPVLLQRYNRPRIERALHVSRRFKKN